MLKHVSLIVLQKALNQALRLDDTMPEKIKQFQGKRLKLVINPPAIEWLITFNESEIQLHAENCQVFDTLIETSPIGLMQLARLPADKLRSAMRISGDLVLGQQLKALFEQLDIDWEGHLAGFTGDVVAYQVGSWFRRGRAFKQQITSSLHQNVNEYIHEELRLFPPREEIEDFFDDIDALSLQTERLLARYTQWLDNENN